MASWIAKTLRLSGSKRKGFCNLIRYVITRTKNANRNKGFTLIELLVVISIIALLLAILMPALSKVKEVGRRTVCATQMHDINLSVRIYAQDSDGLLPAMYVLADGTVNSKQDLNHWTRWWRVWNGSSHYYWNMGLLWKAGITEGDGKIFYCPSAKDNFPYKDYSTNGFPTDYQAMPTSALGVRVPYSFNPECMSLSNRQRIYTKISQMNNNSLLLLDLMTNAGITHEKGWNVLKGDGSVVFSIERDVQEIIVGSTDFEGTDFQALDEIIRLLKR